MHPPQESPSRLTGGEPTLDRATIERLRELGASDDGLLVELIDLYLEDAQGRVRDLLAAVETEDLEKAVECAHTLKSASANIGALVFSGLCKEIETRARSGEEITDLVATCPKVFRDVEAALVDLRSSVG